MSDYAKIFTGLVPGATEADGILRGDCPVCTTAGSLTMNADTGTWSCAVCHEESNAEAFLAYVGNVREDRVETEASDAVRRMAETTERRRLTLTPGLRLPDGTIIEMIRRGGRSHLLVARSTTPEPVPVDLYKLSDGRTCVPADHFGDDGSIGRTVFLPTEAAEYGTTERLWGEVHSYLSRWFDFAPGWDLVVCAYVFMTYVHDSFTVVPYLRALHPDFGVGKTRMGRVVSLVCLRPIWLSGATSTAVLVRTMDKWQGTLFVDEVDLNPRDQTYQVMAKILNTSNGPFAAIGRCELTYGRKGRYYVPKFYNACGPKIVTQRRPFKDDAVESRFITIPMAARRSTCRVPDWTKVSQGAAWLRDKLTLWRFRNAPTFSTEGLVDIPDVPDRTYEIFSPLATVAPNARAREAVLMAAAYHAPMGAPRLTNDEAAILRAIRKVRRCRGLGTYVMHDLADMTGLTSRGVGAILRRLGFAISRRSKGRVFILDANGEALLEQWETKL
jgi:hypothetical protein